MLIQGFYQELSPNSSNTCQTRSETCSPGTSTSPHSSQELQSFVEDGCPAPLVIPTPSSSFRQGCSGWDKLEALLAVTEQVQCGTAWQQTQDNSEKYHPSPAYKSAFKIVGSGRCAVPSLMSLLSSLASTLDCLPDGPPHLHHLAARIGETSGLCKIGLYGEVFWDMGNGVPAQSILLLVAVHR